MKQEVVVENSCQYYFIFPPTVSLVELLDYIENRRDSFEIVELKVYNSHTYIHTYTYPNHGLALHTVQGVRVVTIEINRREDMSCVLICSGYLAAR